MSLSPTSQAPVSESADVLARMMEYVCHVVPELASAPERAKRLEQSLRAEFGGGKVYVASKPDREAIRREVGQRFNGRNASAVARELGISRASVYRYLKQPG